MAMNAAYLNALADYGGTLVKYLGLIDDTGTELAGGSYARLAVSWTAAADGLIRPTSDLPFQVPGGATVAGWRGYSAVSGGTDYDGKELPAQPFVTAGTYTLLAANTAIDLDAT